MRKFLEAWLPGFGLDASRPDTSLIWINQTWLLGNPGLNIVFWEFWESWIANFGCGPGPCKSLINLT